MDRVSEQISKANASSQGRTDANLANDSNHLGGIPAEDYATKKYVQDYHDSKESDLKGYIDRQDQSVLEEAKEYTNSQIRNQDFSGFAKVTDVQALDKKLSGELEEGLTAQKNYTDQKTNQIVADVNANFDDVNGAISKLNGNMDNLFQSVSSGKSQIAGAITDKGVTTSASDSFSTMATNIRAISTSSGEIDPNFVNTSDGNATENDIRLGKIAYAKGQKIYGSLVVSEGGGSGECYNTSDATATPDKILKGYTAYGTNGKMIGTYEENGGTIIPGTSVEEIYGDDVSTLDFTEFDFSDRDLYNNGLPDTDVCFVYHSSYKKPLYAINVNANNKEIITWAISGDQFVNRHEYSFEELGIKYADESVEAVASFDRQKGIACSNIDKTSPYCIIKMYDKSSYQKMCFNILEMKVLYDENNGYYLGFEGKSNISSIITLPDNWFFTLAQPSMGLDFNNDILFVIANMNGISSVSGFGIIVFKIYPASRRISEIARKFHDTIRCDFNQISFINSKIILAIGERNNNTNRYTSEGYLFLLDEEKFRLSNGIKLNGDIIGVTPNADKIIKYSERPETSGEQNLKLSLTNIAINYSDESITELNTEETEIKLYAKEEGFQYYSILFASGQLLAMETGGEYFYILKISFNPFSISKIAGFEYSIEENFPSVQFPQVLGESTLIIDSPIGGKNDQGRLGMFYLKPSTNIVVAIKYKNEMYYKEGYNSSNTMEVTE